MSYTGPAINLGEAEVKKESEKALQVDLDSGDTIWVPKSVIHEDSEIQETGDEGDIIVAKWFADQEDLEGDTHNE